MTQAHDPGDSRLDSLLGHVVEEFLQRGKQGASPDLEDYVQQYPEIAQVLREVIPALQVLRAPPDTEKLSVDLDARGLDTAVTPPSSADRLAQLSPPGYEILAVLGRGGMGVVYKARQVSLNRLVALKMVRAEEHSETEERRRFQSEALAVARLQHPNIVQIFEVGEHHGVPFLSLEYVEGGSLNAHLNSEPQPSRQAAEQTAILARAIQVAHEKGLVHRDLKPANILVAEDGTLKVTDFGLVKLLGEESAHTQTGAIVGTPSFMAPEQASGRLSEVGPAADVYALGVILYDLLTGRPPFKGATPLETLQQVRSQEPVSPRQLQPGCPKDLETICLKCLEKSPGRRYPSAAELADDLQAHLEGRPIKARPVSRWERTGKWIRRYPALSASLLIVALALLTIMGILATSNVQIQQGLEREREISTTLQQKQWELQTALAKEKAAVAREQHANQELKETLTERDVALERERRVGALSLIALANKAYDDSDMSLMHQYLQQCPTDLRHIEWNFLYHRNAHAALVYHGHRQAVEGKEAGPFAVAYSPDGKVLASLGRSEVRIWKADTGEDIAALSIPLAASGRLAFSPDGKHLVVRTVTSTRSMNRELQVRIIVWDIVSDDKLWQRQFATGGGTRVNVVRYSADGMQIHTLCSVGVKTWDARSGQLLRSAALSKKLTIGDISPDSSWFAECTFTEDLGSTVVLRNLQSSEKRLEWNVKSTRIRQMAVNAKGTMLATVDQNGLVQLWSTRDGQLVRLVGLIPDRLPSLTFSPDGTLLATGGESETVRLWEVAAALPSRDLHSTRLRAVFRGHTFPIRGLTFSPDGKAIASHARDGTVRIWQLARKESLVIRDENLGYMAFDPSRGRLAYSSCGQIKIIDPRTGQNLLAFSGVSQPAATKRVESLKFSPDGKLLAGAILDWSHPKLEDESPGIHLWDATSGRLLLIYKEPPIPNEESLRFRYCLAFSPDSQRIVSASRGGGDEHSKVQVWEARTGKDLFEFSVEGGIRAVAFSPDGRWLATGHEGNPGWVALRNPQTGAEAARIADYTVKLVTDFSTLQFSPDGKLLAFPGSEHAVLVWDVEQRRVLHTLHGHTLAPGCVAFSPDSKRLLTSCSKTIRIWDMYTGKEALTIRETAAQVAFSPDGTRIAFLDCLGLPPTQLKLYCVSPLKSDASR